MVRRFALVSGLAAMCALLAVTASAESFVWPDEVTVVQPAPDRATVESVGPNWCKGVPTTNPTGGGEYSKKAAAKRINRDLGREGLMGWHEIGQMGRTFCFFPDDPEFKKQGRYFVQRVVNDTGLTPEGAIETINARAHSETWDPEIKQGCQSLEPPDEAHERDEEMTEAKRGVFCRSGGSFTREFRWYFDQSATPPSEIVRLGYVLRCLPEMGADYRPRDLSAIGLCGNDVRALNLDKINQETKSLPNALQVRAREAYAEAKASFADLERWAKPKVDGDPDYKRLLYDVPIAGWKGWEAAYQKHKKGMDAAFAFEDQFFGPSTKAYAKCYVSLTDALEAYIKSQKIKSRADFEDAVSQPVGYVISTAYGACQATAGAGVIGALFLAQTKQSRYWRGPRVAVGFAMLDELNKIRRDRTRFPIEPQWVAPELRSQLVLQAQEPPRTKIPPQLDQWSDEADGVVKAVKPAKGDKRFIVADFKSESWMEPTSTCQSTDEIYKILSSGEILYKQKCRNTGKAKRTYTPKVTKLYKPTAKGMRPGAFAILAVPVSSQSWTNRLREGFPIMIYADKSKKKLVNIFGFTP